MGRSPKGVLQISCTLSVEQVMDMPDKFTDKQFNIHLPSKFSDALRSIVRYRKSIGEEMNMLKNRVHAILTRHGIIIHATDIFGRRGIRSILEESSKLTAMDRIVLSDLIERISDLKERERIIEDQMAVACDGNTSVRLLITISGDVLPL